MLAAGSARVVKNGVHGGEVALRSLGPGDWFGALAVLDHAPRQASVRASDEVVAWRLERQLFLALMHSHPEVRTSFEALAHRHATEDFLLLYSSFSKLPPDALDRLADALERIDVVGGRRSSCRRRPAGPMYVIEQGHFRAYRRSEGEERTSSTCARATSSASSRSIARSRRRRASRRSRTARLLRLRREDFERALGGLPGVPEPDRAARRAARLPSPREGAARLRRGDPPGRRRARARERGAGRAARGSRARPRRRSKERSPPSHARTEAAAAVPARLPARRDGLRRRLPRRWSAATSAERSRLADPRGRAHLDGRDEAGRDHAGRRGARARRARGARVEEPARRAAAAGGRPLGGQPLGRRSTRSTTTTCARRPGARARARSRATSSWSSWSGYAALVAYTERLRGRRPSAARASPGSGRSSARTGGSSRSPGCSRSSRPGCSSLLPILTQVVVDQVLPDGDIGLLWIVLAVIVGVLLAITGATLVQRYLLSADVGPLRHRRARLPHREAARPADELLQHAADRRHRAPAPGVRQVREFFVAERRPGAHRRSRRSSRPSR